MRVEWVASTLHTTSEHGVSSITTADAHNSAASSRLNWRPRRFKWTRPFRWKTKSGFCACAIMFQTCCTSATQTLYKCLVYSNVQYVCEVSGSGGGGVHQFPCSRDPFLPIRSSRNAVLFYTPDCWLEVSIQKVLRPATSTQVFLRFPVSISKCWDGSQHSKLPLHASHVALPT